MIIVKDRVRYEIDFEAGELWRVQDRVREERHLTPKAWEVLQHLVEVPPRTIVRRGDLLNKVWGDVQGSEQSLTKVIRELRLALDDAPENPAFIKTVHGRGFLFIGTKEPPDDEGTSGRMGDVKKSTPPLSQSADTAVIGAQPNIDLGEIQDNETVMNTLRKWERRPGSCAGRGTCWPLRSDKLFEP
jgi:DNA-binding winged helix-turn-helix (wHTH) protein